MTTDFVQATYNEIYDLNTQANEFSVLKFHSPTGRLPRMYLGGFFRQFKKYRYYGCKITLVPAATLPADPLQVSYEAGEPTIDPRDMLNPILHKPYHGEALKTDWMRSANYSALDEHSETGQAGAYAIYYASLQDNSWKKAHIQKGFSASGTPLVRPVATNYQLPVGYLPYASSGVQQVSDFDWDASLRTLGGVTDETGARNANAAYDGKADDRDGGGNITIPRASAGYNAYQNLYLPSDPHVVQGGGGTPEYYNDARDFQFFSSGYRKLGWLDTSARMTVPTTVQGTQAIMREYYSNRDIYNVLPKIYMHVAIMPPAYKTEFYFRCVLTHYFGFKGFRGAMMPIDGASEDNIQLGLQNFNYPAHALKAMIDAEASEPDIVPSLEIESGDVQLNSVGVN